MTSRQTDFPTLLPLYIEGLFSLLSGTQLSVSSLSCGLVVSGLVVSGLVVSGLVVSGLQSGP
jgi:hypothetical protein